SYQGVRSPAQPRISMGRTINLRPLRLALLSRPRTEPVVQPVEPRLDHGSPAPQQGHVDVATSVHSAVRSCGPPDLRLPAQAIGIASVSSSPERNPSTWACTHFDAMSDGYVRDGNVTTG